MLCVKQINCDFGHTNPKPRSAKWRKRQGFFAARIFSNRLARLASSVGSASYCGAVATWRSANVPGACRLDQRCLHIPLRALFGLLHPPEAYRL